ncbi:hypothetical protein Rsub_12809 [Raphidocelis subcapitata]|uniref:Uncharacterized protein n=1 Tax=Raphidocelis subcapitata TaxID=307507 RepID=A0A2V0PJU1_9CHLO|nr:hypothetical protein Rsub_12809 [Raphidocelis subcapitata]|eukprot:GBG00065.1 hypothetical protein Rsub_12809 [Raphidocelis subcapitata]
MPRDGALHPHARPGDGGAALLRPREPAAPLAVAVASASGGGGSAPNGGDDPIEALRAKIRARNPVFRWADDARVRLATDVPAALLAPGGDAAPPPLSWPDLLARGLEAEAAAAAEAAGPPPRAAVSARAWGSGPGAAPGAAPRGRGSGGDDTRGGALSDRRAPPSARGPASWGLVTPRSARFGSWYLPVRDWHVRGEATSTWERAPSHLEQIAAVHKAAAAAAAAAAAGGGGPSPTPHSQRALALPSPIDAWTGRRQRIAPALLSAASGVLPAAAPAFAAPAGSGSGSGMAAAAAVAGAGAPLPAHSRWLGGGGSGSTAAAALATTGGSCGGSVSPSRADSVVMSNHVLEQEREARRAERARERLAKRLAASYGLMAYKSHMRARGLPQAPSLQRLPTPTEADIKNWEARERRRESRRKGRQQGAAAADQPPPKALAGGAVPAALPDAAAPSCRSTRSTESFGSRAGNGGTAAAALAAAGRTAGAPPARALKRPPAVPPLDLGALITQAASGFGGAPGAWAIGAGAGACAREQVPLERPERETLEALLSGRLGSSRSPSPQPGRPLVLSSGGGRAAEGPWRSSRDGGAVGGAGFSARDSLAGGSLVGGQLGGATTSSPPPRHGLGCSCGASPLASGSGAGALRRSGSGSGSANAAALLNLQLMSPPAAQRFGSSEGGGGGWGTSRLGSSSSGGGAPWGSTPLSQRLPERQQAARSTGPLHSALQLLGAGAGSSSGGGRSGGGGGDEGLALQRVVDALEGEAAPAAGAAAVAALSGSPPSASAGATPRSPRRHSPGRAGGGGRRSAGPTFSDGATAGDGGPVEPLAYRLTPRRVGGQRAAAV